MPFSRDEIFLIAGEASGDMHAAHLIEEAKRLAPDTHFFGVGGPKCKAAGMEICVDAESLSAVGVFELWNRADELLHSYTTVRRLIERRRPKLAVLLDLPDFNLRMANHLHRLGVPIIYYISPQVWAWRKGRVETIRRLVDQMMVILPFEKDFYKRHGIDAVYVGNPLSQTVPQRNRYRSQEEILSGPRVAILPGSRKSEIHLHKDLLVGVCRNMKKQFPAIQFRIPSASTLDIEMVRASVSEAEISVEVTPAYEILAWADVALVASGTATLETALVGTPFCLFYRLNDLTMALGLGKVVRKVGYPFGLVNRILGTDDVPELLMEEATVSSAVEELTKLIQSPEKRENQKKAFERVRQALGSHRASETAAASVLSFFERPRTNRALLFS